jgi:phosphoserine phosphatase
VEFYELCLPLWKDLTEADVDTVFDASRWIDGIADVFADIRRRGEYSAVITLSPQFFADRLLRFGVHTVHGAGVLGGGAVDAASVLTPQAKVGIAQDLLERYGIDADSVVAYGDSASDVPLFAELPNTVAVNATESLKKTAATSYDGTDLRGAYAVGRSLLDRARHGAC